MLVRPVAATLLVAVGFTACSRGADPPTPDTDRPIAYTLNNNGYGVIWAVAAEGDAPPLALTPPPPEDDTDASGSQTGAWSPDGTRLAYAGTGDSVRDDQRNLDLYVVDSDGRGTVRLTDDDVMDATPAWSPDGTQIAFGRLRGIGSEEVDGVLAVVDADGGSYDELTSHPEDAAPTLDGSPAWAPDGSRIAFTRAVFDPEGLRSDLYTVSPSGTDERLLLEDVLTARWSPDGTRIVFTTSRDRNGRTCYHECSPSSEVYVANADGTGVRRLTAEEADDISPAWSRDGKRIAFLSDRSNPTEHTYEVYVMDADGENVEQLTELGAFLTDLAWY